MESTPNPLLATIPCKAIVRFSLARDPLSFNPLGRVTIAIHLPNMTTATFQLHGWLRAIKKESPCETFPRSVCSPLGLIHATSQNHSQWSSRASCQLISTPRVNTLVATQCVTFIKPGSVWDEESSYHRSDRGVHSIRQTDKRENDKGVLMEIAPTNRPPDIPCGRHIPFVTENAHDNDLRIGEYLHRTAD